MIILILGEKIQNSLFMASSWVDRQSPFFYNHLLERIETYEIGYCERHLKKVHTAYGRKILNDKLEFIKKFNAQLALEIRGTEEAYDLCKKSKWDLNGTQASGNEPL